MNKRDRRYTLEMIGLIWLCVLMAAALYFRGPSGTTLADMIASNILPVPPPATWLTTNGGVLIQAIGTTFAGCAASIAAYFGMKNHALTTQIHVDTNGRLTNLVDLLNAQTRAAAELAEHVKNAVLVASTKSTADVAQASATMGARMAEANETASTQISMPGAQVTGQIAGRVPRQASKK
jgi:hypothetical protein